MRILFVIPYPLSRIRVRSYGFVQQLRKRHEVHVLALSCGKRERADVRAMVAEGIKVTAIEETYAHKVVRCLSTLSTDQPLQVAFDASQRLCEVLRTLIDSGHYDVLHIECVRALGMLPASPQLLPLPCIWDAVDCISHLYQLGAYHGTTPLLRLLGQHEARRVRVYEHQQLMHFRHILVTSPREREQLLHSIEGPESRSGQQAEINVLPHGLDATYFQPYTGIRQPDTLIFSGKMSFHANIAGAYLLVKQIMPLLWHTRPHVRLIIAGSDPPPSIQRLARDARITVTGYIPDLRPYIARARVALCPLPYAVGIQNKVLEAMALGTPVVASPVAVAGLQTVDGNDLLVASTPEAFVTTILKLLDDDTLWQQLSLQGRRYIEQYHCWTSILTQLETIYTQAIQQSSHTKVACHDVS